MRAEWSVDFWVFGGVVEWCVLVHQTEIYVVTIGRVDVADDLFRVEKEGGEREMADHDAALHEAVSDDGGAGLAVHFGNGGRGDREIVRRMGVAHGIAVGEIFQVGQVDVDEAGERFQRLTLDVGGSIQGDGDVESLGFGQSHRLPQSMKIVVCCDEVNVVATMVLQVQHDFGELGGGEGGAVGVAGNGAVLTETAGHGTAAEKDGSGAVGAGQNGLLPVVRGGAGDQIIVRN